MNDSPSPSIAAFVASDQDEVRELILQGLGDHWGVVETWRNPDLDDIAASYGSGRTLVARDVHGVVGTGTVMPRDMFAAEIVRMSVRSSTRRSGVGRALVGQLVETAREWGVRRVVLETSSSWTDVVAFYLSCGFVITHTDVQQYGENTWFEMTLDR
jgi:putative acetyltransferase